MARTVYKVVRQCGLSGRWYSAFQAGIFRLEYNEGLRTEAVGGSGVLVFFSLEAARDWAKAMGVGMEILEGVGGRLVKLPKLRFDDCHMRAEDLERTWDGQLDYDKDLRADYWPAGTRAVAWFKPLRRVSKWAQ